MNSKSLLLITLLLASTLAADLTKFTNDEGFPCKKDTPAMTVSDETVGYRQNLAHFQEKYPTFILGVSDSNCEICCTGEIILHQLMNQFNKGNLQHEGGAIPIIRLDVQDHAKQLQGAGIYLDYLPRIFLYHNGKFHLFNEEDNLNLLIAFINRVLNPVVELTTDGQVKNFVDTSVEVSEATDFYQDSYRSIRDQFEKLPKVTRVVGFFENSEKFQDKIDELTKVAGQLSERTDLRIGVVTDPKLVQQYKKEAGPFWFNETSHNSIVMFREKKEELGKQRFYDVEADDYDLKAWISFSSLDEVENLNKYTAMILQEVNMPIFCILLPEDWENDEKSKELIQNLKSCAYHYPQIMYTWTNSSDDHYLRDHMTIVWKDLPAMGLLNGENMMPVTYPRNQPFSLDNLKSFFGHFINGTINSSKFTLPDINQDFGMNMPHASRIDISTTETAEKDLNKFISENTEKDRIVLLYDSDKKFFQNNQATFLLELTAYLFEDTGVNTVDFAYVDVNNGTVPENLSNNRIVPHFQLFPAGETTQENAKTDASSSVQELLQFIKDNAKTDLSKAFEGLGWDPSEPIPESKEPKTIPEEEPEAEEDLRHEDL